MSQYDIRRRIRRHANPLDYLQLLRALSRNTLLEIQPTDAQFVLNPSSFLFRDIDFCRKWETQFGCAFLLYGDELQDLSHYLRAKALTLRNPVRIVLVTWFPSMASLEYALSCVLRGEVEDLSNKISASTQSHVSLRPTDGGHDSYLDTSIELYPEIQVFDHHHDRLWREGEHTDFAHKSGDELVTSLALCDHTHTPTASPVYTHWLPCQSSGRTFAVGPTGKPGWISVPYCAQCEKYEGDMWAK